MGGLTERNPKRQIILVEPHPIAVRHLSAVLGRSPATEVLQSHFKLPRQTALSKKKFVLIIDADALPFPLTAYLRTNRNLLANAHILAIGGRISDDEVCRLLSHGIRGFVLYDQVDEKLCAAVEALFKGHTWVTPAVLERYLILSSEQTGDERPQDHDLSSREWEILGLLDRRLADKEIASALGSSVHTIRFHLQNVFRKLGVHDRHSVIEWVRTVGIAHPQPVKKVGDHAWGKNHQSLCATSASR
jgi:DNA-binding NarL/FixJ family response regulator